MITAEQARTKTFNKINDIVDQELLLVETAILSAIKKGSFCVGLDNRLTLWTVHKLEKLGFKIEQSHIFDENESCFISWNEDKENKEIKNNE